MIGCDGKPPTGSTAGGADAQGEDAHAKPEIGVKIDASIRQNMGITFAKVQRRPVQRIMRVPGQFELRPDARREYHATMAGRVELLVKQYDAVESGQLLARIDSPDWSKLRHAAVEAEGEIRLADAKLAVAEAVLEETQKKIAFTKLRVDQLRDAGTRKVELEAALDALTNNLPRLEAELNAKRVELEEANEHFDSQMAIISSH